MQANALFQDRPPLWLYYENPDDKWKRPEYYNLCYETVQRHCGRSFRVISLTRYTIYKYVPDLHKDIWVKCTYAQRMDLIRWELLSRYGGLCLDPYVLVTSDLLSYIHLLDQNDFVAFGCGAEDCEVSTSHTTNCPLQTLRLSENCNQPATRPAVWAMASRPQGTLVNYLRSQCHWLLRNSVYQIRIEPYIFGKVLLWKSLQELAAGEFPAKSLVEDSHSSPPPWSYVHVGRQCNDCDAKGQPFTMDRFIKNESIQPFCISNMRCVPLLPDSHRKFEYPDWFVNASREQLLGNPNTLVGQLWRWSLLNETPFPILQQRRGFQSTPHVEMPRYYASSPWTS